MPPKAPVVTPDRAGIEAALDALASAKPVGMPTETVYGLAADATSPTAVAGIFSAKGRPEFNPLIAHCETLHAAQEQVIFDERALALANAFWPGPLTLILPVSPTGSVCELARAGLSTLGVRVPSHPVAQELLHRYAKPLAAPSANPSGRLSPTSAQDVANELGNGVALVLDGGQSAVGLESTIVSVLPGEAVRLLRTGAIAREMLEEVCGPLETGATAGIIAPGQLSSHYAPGARLRLNATEVREGEVLLGFGPDCPKETANLSFAGDCVEAAANLFRLLRELDASGAQTIAIMPVPEEGLGEAINDRLRRAAAPRS